MGAKISWPKNPTLNQVYTSPNGKSWIFKDCIWMHTCCPSLPCNFEDGLTYTVSFVAGENPVQVQYYIQYQGKDYNGNDTFFSVFDCDNSIGLGVYFDTETNLWTAFIGQADGNPDFEIFATSTDLEDTQWTSVYSYIFGQEVSFGYGQCSAPMGYGFCGTADLGYGVILNPFYLLGNSNGSIIYLGADMPDNYDTFIVWDGVSTINIVIADLINGVTYTASLPSTTGIPPTGNINLTPNAGGYGNIILSLNSSNTICCPT